MVYYQGKEATLSPEQGEMLREFVLNSSETRPTTRAAFTVNENMLSNTYVTRVNRLRHKLGDNGFPPLFQTKRYQNEPAYYFDDAYAFHVMYRVDEEIEYA